MAAPKISVRAKIMMTIIAVSAVVLALGAYAAFDALESTQTRGNYLDKHFDKFLRKLQKGGAAEYAAARLIAQDPTLTQGLEAGDAAQVLEAVKRLGDPLQGSITPDVLFVTDSTGKAYPVKGSVKVPKDWQKTRLFQDVREGKPVRGALAIIGGAAYRVSGAAVRGTSGVAGTVVVGQNLTRFLGEFRDDSTSKDPGKQHRVSLVRNGKVVSSALPKKMHQPFEKAIKAPKEVAEATQKVLVLDIGGVVYDFKRADAVGYVGSGDPTSKMGDFYHIRTRAHVAKKVTAITWNIAIMFGIAAVIAIVVGYILAVGITRPIQRYIAATEDLAQGQGDLTKRIEIQSRDELGTLAGNLNRVFAKIHSLASGVQRSAFQVGSSSGEISTVSQQMLQGAKDQAGKISDSTAAVTELSSSIQQVAENAAEATKRAKQSGEAVTDAIARLDQIRKTVEDAAARIDTLGESGKRIGNIVEVIRQISEQTTMLALNAAIEAAHAGEHGRGFAVVADEVSSLAKRVGQSAKDIEDLIATIRDQTSEAVHVMEDGTREVEEGTSLVRTTLSDLQTLINVIDDTAGAVQEQAIASDEIARNMDAVQRIASEVLASSENAVAQGDHLQRLADALNESVGGFKIDPARAELDEVEHKALPGSSA